MHLLLFFWDFHLGLKHAFIYFILLVMEMHFLFSPLSLFFGGWGVGGGGFGNGPRVRDYINPF